MDDIQIIRASFDEVKEIRHSIITLFDSLSQKISSLQSLYVSYVKRSEGKEHNFGIDSLHFQRRLMEHEQNGMRDTFSMIGNQIYKDYYKLYRLLSRYVETHITDKKVLDACHTKRFYPTYKDLEPLKEYDFDTIIDLHHDILHIIGELQSYTATKEREWKVDEGKLSNGLNIDNFVNTSKYQNALIQQQTTMFIEYVKAFNKFHTKYLTRFNLKLKLMYGQIQADIKLEAGGALARTHSDGDTGRQLARMSSIDDGDEMKKYLGQLENKKTPNMTNALAEVLDNLPSSEESENENQLQEPVTAIQGQLDISKRRIERRRLKSVEEQTASVESATVEPECCEPKSTLTNNVDDVVKIVVSDMVNKTESEHIIV